MKGSFCHFRELLSDYLGHSGEVFACRFDPTGQHIASGSMDRSISMFFWSSDAKRTNVTNGNASAMAHLR